MVWRCDHASKLEASV